MPNATDSTNLASMLPGKIFFGKSAWPGLGDQYKILGTKC